MFNCYHLPFKRFSFLQRTRTRPSCTQRAAAGPAPRFACSATASKSPRWPSRSCLAIPMPFGPSRSEQTVSKIVSRAIKLHGRLMLHSFYVHRIVLSTPVRPRSRLLVPLLAFQIFLTCWTILILTGRLVSASNQHQSLLTFQSTAPSLCRQIDVEADEESFER